MANETSGILKGLRTLFDGSSVFMNGHQIKRVRTGGRKRCVPAWATDDEKVRSILLRSFPKLHINARQRKSAARWLMVMQLYFRSKKSMREVSEDMGVSLVSVKRMVVHVGRAAVGRRARDGRLYKTVDVVPTKPLVESSLGVYKGESKGNY